MACVSPPEPDDKVLLLYLDGEADDRIIAHLEQCPHCRERAGRLSRLQDRLTARLYRISCPDPAALGEYHLGLLPRDQAAAVAQHLNECPHCRSEVAQLTGYLANLAPDLEFSPLERVKMWVARLVDTARAMDRSGATALAPAYVGVRGEEEGPRLYQAGEVQIAIEVQDDAGQPDRKMLLGLVTGADTREWKAHLWQGDQCVKQATIDALGNLVMSDLASGSYELILSAPEVQIHIQELQVGAS